ncbi:GNAT family N-acetyltransferase [Thalassotalea euphylliae]|uniref:GNAT family N-acetyltransferase n=1 Tax=Thalassotalea euphylliae TaxID=1655234 RepID=UPI00362E376E
MAKFLNSAHADKNWFEKASKYFLTRRHRRTVILLGEFSWALDNVLSLEARGAKSLTLEELAQQSLIFSEYGGLCSPVNSKTYRHHLGTEQSVVCIFDENLNVDAFAALSGVIIAGGVMYLWLPPQLVASSLFCQRLIAKSKMNQDVWLFEQEVVIDELYCTEQQLRQQYSQQLPNQQQLNIIHHLTQQNSEGNADISIITADRGRGKSSALALSVINIVRANYAHQNIVITAPHRMACNVFFSHLEKELGVEVKGNKLNVNNSCISFLSVDELLDKNPTIDLLLIDEAAGIPVYLLKQLLQHHQKVALATTIYGYEGAGRGFTAKLLPYIDAAYSCVNKFTLSSPIRWAEHDPQEAFIFDTCVLNADLPVVAERSKLSALKYLKLNKALLAVNEQLLKEVFAILVTAHYQTKPSDLKRLLDDASIQIHVLFSEQSVYAVALLSKEGGFAPALKSDILAGKRRVKGHMVPQSLAQQALTSEALNFDYLRVMRIAVHPLLQGQGIGSQLLACIEAAEKNNTDFFATSFAASTEVVRFWQKNRYSSVKLGFKADASSGEHSLLMLKSTNTQSETLLTNLAVQFFSYMPHWLEHEFFMLPIQLKEQIMQEADAWQPLVVDERDRIFVNAYINNATLFSLTRVAIARWLEKLSEQQNVSIPSLLDAKWLKLADDKSLCKHYDITGKKALHLKCQQLLKSLLVNS